LREESYCRALANKIRKGLGGPCVVAAISEESLKNSAVGKVVDCLIEVACRRKRILLVIERAKTVDEDELKQIDDFLKNIKFAGGVIVPVLHKMKKVKRKVVRKPKRSGNLNVLSTTYASCEQSISAKVGRLLD